MSYGATIGFIGVLASLERTVDPLPILLKGLRLVGVSVGPRDVLDVGDFLFQQS